MKNGKIFACPILRHDEGVAFACLFLIWPFVTAHCAKVADVLRSLVKFLGLAVSIVCTQNAFAALTPGSITGNFSVSESGAASYSVPIAVPPGTAGMEPRLSLNYSSQGGNGIAGVGWSLGGLSAITRCPQTIVHDGAMRGVELDANDRFCLDGQRLILVSGATYGAVGAEYRTEIESFSKIVSIGGTAGDPQSFFVKTKAGQIIEIGNTADSRVEAQGKTVAIAWAVSKISDTVGNYIAFTFFEDNANGEHRITRIDYTGNAATNIAPYNAVEFQYEARPDPSTGYLAGSLMQATQRLTNIQTKASGALVMDFQLGYETVKTTGRSRLGEMTQCAGNGDCLNPTTFGWQDGEAASFSSVAVESAAQTGASTNTWFAMGDVNADGRSDAVTLNTSRDMRLYIGGDSGSVSQTQQFITPFVSTMPGYFNPMDWRFWIDDLNGDGYGEPIICGVSGQYASNGFGPWVVVPWAAVPQGGGQAVLQMQATNGLFLGSLPSQVKTYTQGCMGARSPDGKADFVWHAAEYYKGFELFTDLTATAAYGTVTFTQEGASVPLRNSNTSVTLTTDINGDGHGDMVRYDPSTGALHTWLQRNKAFAAVQTTSIDAGGTPNDRWFTAGDVNGDGLGDMVLHTPADGKLKVWLSKGNGTITGKFETVTFSTGGTRSDTWFLMVDVNADGRADAVKYTPSNGNIVFAVSNGNGTFGMPVTALIATGFNPTPTVGPNPTTAWFQPADVNGDGLPDWVIYHPGEGKIKVNLGQGVIPDLLISLTDGHGATRDIIYKPLTDPSVYTKGSGSTYPEQDVQGAMYVVSETAADDGTGGQFRNAYRYTWARSHLTGRGFLGFAMLEQTDLQTGIVTRTNYRQDFPYIGMPTIATKTSSGGVELSRVENTYAEKVIAGAGKFPYLAYSKEQSRDLNNVILPTRETWNESFDDWGNVTKITTQTSDGFLKTTDNVYSNDPANWLLGRLTRASVTNAVNGWSQTRVSAFEYHPTTGLLTKETLEPDAASVQFRLDTTYTHDAFGNRKTATVSSPATGIAAIATRTTTTIFDARGQFPATITNAVGHTESKTYDPRFGTLATLTGPNLLTTTWQVDNFGRKTREDRADGTKSTWTYVFCDAACPGNAVYRAGFHTYGSNDSQAAPINVDHFDRLHRSIRMATQGFDGRWIYKDTQYDNQGRVAQVSRPYYPGGDPIYWARSEYDDLGRITRAFEADDAVNPALTVGYNGLTVSRSNRKSQTTTEVKNSQGQTVSVTDAQSKTTTYAYDPFGNLVQVTNPSNVVENYNFYDLRGRKFWGYSVDMGWWQYRHSALGELVQQTDAKNQVTTFKYDLLSRMTQRTEPGLTSDWVWDTSYTAGKGKLFQAKTNAGYARTHYYDNKGRPQLVLTNLGAGNPLLWLNTTYDTFGRQSEQYYPSNLGIKHVYNPYGYLAEIRNANDNSLFWQANIQDVEGRIVKETYGNGVVINHSYNALNGRLVTRQDVTAANQWIQFHYYDYDALGNVQGRWNSGTSIWEAMTYDPLNRLTQVDRSVGETVTETVAYDALGNITSKTGVGTYTYADPSGKIHAVTQAGANSYSYDANGNLSNGGGRVIGWTAWNMPGGIIQGGQSSTWSYGPEHDRYKLTTNGRTTWYLNPGINQGGHYERTQYVSGTVEHRTTLYGGGRPIGEVLSFDGTAPEQTRYFHSDGQGSIAAVTDNTGTVITRYKYDPWGKQTVISGSNTGIAQTRQGHTGHEMLDGGLTHMNGRLYDPSLARFVSADPYVDNPYNLQSLNRYSYVWNNPLGYTDPSGYFGWEISPSLGRGLFMLGGMMFGAVLGPAGPIFAGGGFATTVASGALAGGVSGFIGSGGNAQAARQGALAGGLFAGAGQLGNSLGLANGSVGRALLHAGAGCISANAGGGSCGSGAMQAGFTKFASANLPDYGDFGNLVKYAVIGGTASAIGGDKFANGAMTGAWQYLFNELTTSRAAAPHVARLRAGSAQARGMLDAMAADPDTHYYLDVGSVPDSAGGGMTKIQQPSPSFWDRLMGRSEQATVIMVTDSSPKALFMDVSGRSFTPSVERVMAHELGHGYSYLQGGYMGYRMNYDAAINFENQISRQLNSRAPLRAISDHGRGP